MIYGF